MTKWIVEYMGGDSSLKNEEMVKMLTSDECSDESEWRITRIDDKPTEAFLEDIQDGNTIAWPE